jgi:hypothetical protein
MGRDEYIIIKSDKLLKLLLLKNGQFVVFL